MKSFIKNKKIIFKVNIFIIFSLALGLGYYFSNFNTNNKILEEKVKVIRSNHNYVKLNNINKNFLNSVIATEDHRFYDHGAIDFISITRATLNNLKARKVVEGGSTITQQLAKNLCLSNERSFKRKFNELIISIELEKKYSKNEILELYVNVINFGDGYIGIGEAAKGYFKKSASDLNYNESTILAGLPQAPSLYALSTKNGLAQKRQKQVIDALQKYDKSTVKDDITLDYLFNNMSV